MTNKMNPSQEISILSVTQNFIDAVALINDSSKYGMCISLGIENEKSIFEKILSTKPDFVILEGKYGLELIRKIKSILHLSTKCILCLSELDNTSIINAIFTNADAYYLKDTSSESLINCVQCLIKGERYISPILIKKIQSPVFDKRNTVLNQLSQRENETLRLLSYNYSIKRIAELLFISEKTVEAHKNNIIKKLDLTGSRELRQIASQLYKDSSPAFDK
ncbi:response regulator transcription factor [Emticicia sp. C21]|uniref:LuxR C-terminal-related transcriptional regulator n=1 Tax=Emticicia sp. C21 TaxID=2302915 RepID=UPI000E34487C|nr:response regulator transcription factor [Emticicia sp. C21]RFS18326.1 DNA-binding response regulator [Emticicia sp. C21]